MPVDPTSLRSDIASETPVWPVELPIASPEFYRELQVPKTIIQDAKLLSQFFKTQATRLYALEHTEKLKTGSAEIHEFEEIAGELEAVTPLTPEEEQLAERLYRKIGEGERVGVQSEMQDLIDRADEYVRANPVRSDAGTGEGMVDIFDQVFVTELNEQKEERNRRYQELLAAAKDPETIMLIIAYRYTDAYGSKFGKVMEAYKGQLDQLDRLGAKMALAGASTGEIAKANAELAKNTNYISMATFAIQNIKQKIDQVQNSAQSVLSNIHEQEKQVISNVRGG